jgi:hypothetical protein
MAFYLHLGPFSRQIIGAIDKRLREIDQQGSVSACERVLDHAQA